jgi:hypothetical protein
VSELEGERRRRRREREHENTRGGESCELVMWREVEKEREREWKREKV